MANLYNEYNKPMRFDGDIIITDPCYIMNDDTKPDYSTSPEWWDFFSKAYLTQEVPYKTYHYPEASEYEDARIPTFEEFCKMEHFPENHSFYDEETKNFLYEFHVINATHPEMYSETFEKEKAAYYEAQYKWQDENESDWEKCGCGENMGALGIQNSLVAGTIYGDWSCTTYQLNPTPTSDYKVIGHFCADAGLVGVFLLDEVMKYNPKYKDITDAPHCVTLIKDFHGEVSINIIHDDEYDEDEVRVVGTGNINFETRQTGL